MKTLATTSVVSVLCTASVLLFTAPQLVTTGVIEPGPYFELMVVLPTPVGLAAALVGAIAGTIGFTIGLVRRVDRAWAGTLMALGHVITCVLAIAIVVWSQKYGSTGWELLFLPASLMLGQILVAAGLITAVVSRRRGTRPAPGDGQQIA
ncbi:hypothetical protein [Nocardia donostiensis]|uniref:Uncharacterized protein n=1 Tax=Nocardia donostiensis TaxID=1538463 RepID=A0A1V2TF19_9NOCA|nr:hypothetical protein [Nocardia donostiensis]ONM48074.1 hypothetical protein B0T46_13710 [Nocardia donostiensis]OQS13940.1 hypothetical protein B0T36_17680 [Nocardia donostiensis]OQS20304.1 hypothetical protein B0T44_10365 [Nocardia donostiensis]